MVMYTTYLNIMFNFHARWQVPWIITYIIKTIVGQYITMPNPIGGFRIFGCGKYLLLVV